MGLQANAVQWNAGLFEPFEKLEEMVASIVFDSQIILEAEFIDHQLRLWRQLTCLPQGPCYVVNSEGLQEKTVSQAVHPIAGLDGLVDDVPLGDCMAIAILPGRTFPLWPCNRPMGRHQRAHRDRLSDGRLEKQSFPASLRS